MSTITKNVISYIETRELKNLYLNALKEGNKLQKLNDFLC
jgi:hypothetical protein